MTHCGKNSTLEGVCRGANDHVACVKSEAIEKAVTRIMVGDEAGPLHTKA